MIHGGKSLLTIISWLHFSVPHISEFLFNDSGFVYLFPPCSEFCNMARKIYIWSRLDVKNMSPGFKLPAAASFEGDGTVLSLESFRN